MQTLSRRQFTSTVGVGLGLLARPARAAASAQAATPTAGRTPAPAAPLSGGLIGLDSNENPYGPSPRALAAMTRSQGWAARYPDAKEVEVSEALARLHKVAPEQIVLGCGS